jgi:hypothetical protein
MDEIRVDDQQKGAGKLLWVAFGVNYMFIAGFHN